MPERVRLIKIPPIIIVVVQIELDCLAASYRIREKLVIVVRRVYTL